MNTFALIPSIQSKRNQSEYPSRFSHPFLSPTYFHGYEQPAEDMELRGLILQIPKQKIKALCMKTVFRSVRDLFWASRNSKDPKQVPEAGPVPLGGDGVTPCSREGRQRSGCFIQAGTNWAEQQRGTAGKLCLRLVESCGRALPHSTAKRLPFYQKLCYFTVFPKYHCTEIFA